MIEMKVRGLTLDPLTNMPIVILKDVSGEKALPIWVGIFEANAIALKMEDVPTPRPMTHDLIKNLLDGVQASIEKVIVNDLKNNTFYANIYLTLKGNSFTIDARPSDAIALALRAEAPIYVEQKVIEEARSLELTDAQVEESEDPEKLKEWLDNIKPEDFGSLEC